MDHRYGSTVIDKRNIDRTCRDEVLQKNKNQITSMNNRKIELEEQHGEVQQRIDRIQIEIETYRRISSEHQTELGTIHLFVDETTHPTLRSASFVERLIRCSN